MLLTEHPALLLCPVLRQDGLQHGLVGHVDSFQLGESWPWGREHRGAQHIGSKKWIRWRATSITAKKQHSLPNERCLEGKASFATKVTKVQAEAPPGILFGALRKAIRGGITFPEHRKKSMCDYVQACMTCFTLRLWQNYFRKWFDFCFLTIKIR